MKLNIPRLGDRLVLTRPWTVVLAAELRNHGLLRRLGVAKGAREDWYWWNRSGSQLTNGQSSIKVSIPKGTIVIVDRIYIRQGAKGFDSVSFKFPVGAKLPWRGRFWVSLDDAHNLHYRHTAP